MFYNSISAQMANEFLAWKLLLLEHRMRNRERRVERREWQDNHDPFDLSDDMFINLYRVSLEIALELINILGPQLQPQRLYGLSVDRVRPVWNVRWKHRAGSGYRCRK